MPARQMIWGQKRRHIFCRTSDNTREQGNLHNSVTQLSNKRCLDPHGILFLDLSTLYGWQSPSNGAVVVFYVSSSGASRTTRKLLRFVTSERLHGSNQFHSELHQLLMPGTATRFHKKTLLKSHTGTSRHPGWGEPNLIGHASLRRGQCQQAAKQSV